MAQNKPTTDQHFIPQCYLNQFSTYKEYIYQYDVLSKKQIPSPVPIKSICYQKNLYEFTDEKGKFIYRNMIEHILVILEGIFADTMRSIRRKAFNKNNFKTSCFLDSGEKNYLAIYMTIQQLRLPWFIDDLENEIKKKYENILEDSSIRNLAVLTSLPIYKNLNINEKNILLDYFKLFGEMSYFIGVSNNDCIITSDNPVTLLFDDSYEHLVEVIFPLSSKMVLYMRPVSQTEIGCKNRLIELTSENIEYINQITIRMSKRWIYSKQPLTKEQTEWIASDRS